MKTEFLIIGVIVAAMLIMRNAGAGASAPRTGNATVGPGGTIFTPDSQFFYDGEFWYGLTSGGYRLIDGQ